jgi:rare lipoprotein A
MVRLFAFKYIQFILVGIFITAAIILLDGCSSSPRFTKDRTAEPQVRNGSRAGNASQKSLLSSEGIASYYAGDFHGKKTANGEVYPFKLERIIDLSLGAATQLGMTTTGTAKVRLEVLEWGDDEYVQ